MDGEDTLSASTERSNGSGRLSWSSRPGHNRSWARISLGGFTQRRRDKEPKGLGARSPSRRMTLGGGGQIREEGVGLSGASSHGRHGIRYQQQAEQYVEEELQPEEASSLNPRDPVEEEDVVDEKEGQKAAGSGEQTKESGEDGGVAKNGGGESVSATNEGKHRRDGSTLLLDIGRGLDTEGSSGVGGVTLQSSPSSRRGSTSPGRMTENRARNTLLLALPNSPPVLSGPFSRARSRSPRQRMSISNAGLDNLPRLPGELGRLSNAGGDRAPNLSKELSASVSVSTHEEYASWGEGDGALGNGSCAEEERKTGAFTESALTMARLRLPNMELGFEEDGFFGIDVRNLIIGNEIARGAFGVVHLGRLLPGEQSDSPSQAVATETKDGGNVSSPRGEGEGGEAGGSDAPEVPEGDAQGGVGVPEGGGGGSASEEGKDVAGVAGENGNATPGEKGIEVAVKIQRVPEDEEEQANLLGELAMLRNYKHPHLVEFIGTAMAMERGTDTVMLAMELCHNGALREVLKLNIGWPLKVRIAVDLTDGLQYLHQHGIIHRDIKTPNVLIDSSWRAKLCDYNFAIEEDSTIKQDFCAGTAEFMSPEVLMSEDYGLSSDVFSLGMIFVEMLTGKEPSPTFPDRQPQNFFVVTEEEVKAELLPDCPASFSLLQSQCVFSEPAERPTTEDAHNWLQDLLNETGEDNIALPQKVPPLPVLTEGAAIAREGNVINASPQGNDHHWFDPDTMEHQIGSMVENAVDRALAERGQHLGLSGPNGEGEEESTAKLEEMKGEMEALRAACGERDTRISELEIQALRNTSTLKMLSSALEVAYKMLEAQQAIILQPNSNATLEVATHDAKPMGQNSYSDQDDEDLDAI